MTTPTDMDELAKITVTELDHLTFYQFEQLVKELFMFDGFEVGILGHEGDRHIELSLRRGSDSFVGQARKGHGQVHERDVLRLRKAVEQAHMTGGYLITTAQAETERRQFGIGGDRLVRLVDGGDLVKWVERFARAITHVKRASDIALLGDDYRMAQWVARHYVSVFQPQAQATLPKVPALPLRNARPVAKSLPAVQPVQPPASSNRLAAPTRPPTASSPGHRQLLSGGTALLIALLIAGLLAAIVVLIIST